MPWSSLRSYRRGGALIITPPIAKVPQNKLAQCLAMAVSLRASNAR